MPNNPIQVVDDLALIPLTQTEVANINLSSLGVMTITSLGGGGDMLKSSFATINPGAGFVDKAMTATSVPYTGITSLPGGSINFLRADGTFAPPPGQTYSIVSIANDGLAPALQPSGGSGYYLRGDASWQQISALPINYSQILGVPTSLFPTPHQSTHTTAGQDLIPSPTTTKPGLVPLLPALANQATSFLRGDSSWTVIPPVSSSASGLIPQFPGTANTFWSGAGNYVVPSYGSLSGVPTTFQPIPHAISHITAGTPGPGQDLIPNFQIGGSLPGLVPASTGGTTNFLRADGVWSAPTGLGTLASPSGSGSLQQLPPAPGTTFYLGGDNNFHQINTLPINYGQLIGVPVFSGGSAGLVPNGPGGALALTEFLRGDGTFAVPSGGPLVSTTQPGLVNPIPSSSGGNFFLNGNDVWTAISTITVDYTSQVTGKPLTFAPSGHNASHVTGGSDIIGPATVSKTGLVPLLPSTTPQLQFLRGDGAFFPIPIATATTSGLVPAPSSQINQWFRGDATFQPIPPVSTSLPGLIPAFPNNQVTFFRGDGSYTGVDYVNAVINKPTSFSPSPHASSHTTGGDQIPPFTATVNGFVPFSGGGTTTFLRADGQWISPSGSGDVVHTRQILTNNFSLVGGGDLSADRTISLVGDVATPGANFVYSYVASNRGWNAFSSFPVATIGAAGLLPALSNSSAQFLNGTGSFSTPLNFSSTLAGYAPSSGGGITNFLRADGSWIAPPPMPLANSSAAGSVPSLQPSPTTFYLRGDNTWQTLASLTFNYGQIIGVPVFAGSLPGLVPNSAGSASAFLRGDGVFLTPPLAASASAGYIAGLQLANTTAYWARGDNSWNLLPNSVLVSNPWTMPPVGLTVSGVTVNDSSSLKIGQTLATAGLAANQCFMEIASVDSLVSITLLNQAYVVNPAPGTFIPGSLMFIIGPGVMTNLAPGFVPTPTGNVNQFLNATGHWSIPPGGGGSGTVFTQGSIVGDGSTGNRLQLTNDSSSPGAFKFYSTDAIGTKGWLPLTYSWETSAQFTMPGINAVQNIALVSNVGVLIGMTLVIEDSSAPANQCFLEVVSVNGDGVHIVAKNLGYAINSPGNTLFLSAAAVTLAGPATATATTPGFVPKPPGDTFSFLRGDAQFQVPVNVSITNAGYAPIAPNDLTKFLRGDGNWGVPTITQLAITGTQGAVPGLTASNQSVEFLRGDNQWAMISSMVIPYSQLSSVPSTFSPSIHGSHHVSGDTDPIPLFNTSTSVSGLVPGSSGATTTFLRADGTWAAAPTGPGLATAGSDGLLKGLVASPTLQYLRGDNSWQLISSLSIAYGQLTGTVPFATTTHASVGLTHLDNGSDPLPVVAGLRTGLVPALPPSAPNTKFLRGDASWTPIPTVGNGTLGLMIGFDGNATHFFSGDGTYKSIPTANATTGGLLPTPPNLTYQYLRGDATFVTLPLTWNITASFTQPAASSQQNVTFTSTTGLVANMVIATIDAGNLTNYYSVASITNSTVAVLTNINCSGNTAAFGTVNAGSVNLISLPIMTATGSGVVPIPPNGDTSKFLRADATWATPASSGVGTGRQILTQYSITGGGDLSADRTLNLVNDTASPGGSMLYGTNSGGTRGWQAFTSLPLATTSNAGLLLALNGNTANFLNGNGAWTSPSSLPPASAGQAGTVTGLPTGVSLQSTQWLRADNSWQYPNDCNATTASWVMPAVGFTVPGVTVQSTANFDAGMTLLFATGNGTTVCFMEVVSIDSSTTMTLRNQGYNANASMSGNTVLAGPVYINGPGIAVSGFAGLVPNGAGSTSTFLRGDATFAAVPYSSVTGTPNVQLSWAISSSFTQPNVGAQVNVAVTTSAGAVVNRGVIVAGAGYYFIQAVPDLTHITLQNNGHAYNVAPLTAGLGSGGFITGASSANIFTSSWAGDVPVSTSGTANFLRCDGTWNPPTVAQVVTGTAGTVVGLPAANQVTQWLRADNTWQFLWYETATNGTFTVPTTGNPQAITIVSASWPTVGQTVYISDGTNKGFFEITVVTSATSITIKNQGYLSNAAGGGTMTSGSTVRLVGPSIATSTVPGFLPTPPNNTDQWLRGDATWAQAPPLAKTITSTFTWPAFGGTVSIVIDSSANMRVGMALYFPALGVAELTVVTDSTHITIRNNGNTGNAGSTAGIAVGTSIYVGGGGAICTTTTTGDVPIPGGVANTFFSGASATFVQPPNATASTAGYVNPPNNTTTWLRGDATWTAVPYTSLSGYPSNTYQYLRGDGTFAKPSGTLTSTTSTFPVPAANSTVTVAVNAVTWPIVGQKVYITDGTLVMYGDVTTVGSSTSITVRNTGDTGNSISGTMASGASVALVQFQNPVFRQWQAGLEYSPPSSLYAVFGVQNARPHLAFNDSATWTANFFGVVPAGTYLGNGLIVRLKWKSITTNTGNAVWGAAIERLNTAESADSFDTQVTATTACSGTTSVLVETAITITTIDSITAGDGFGLQIQRLGANGSDTLVGDACLRLVTIENAI